MSILTLQKIKEISQLDIFVEMKSTSLGGGCREATGEGSN